MKHCLRGCILFIVLLLITFALPAQVVNLNQSNFPVTAEQQIQAAYEVIARLAPEHSTDFILQIGKDSTRQQDWFSIKPSADGKVIIEGNKGLSLTAGFHHYIKRYTNSFAGQIESNLLLPKQLPVPETEIKESLFKIRNCYNYCTFSYTMAWWDWERWEKELDLLALYGINQPLMIVGLEKVWQNVLKELKFSEENIEAFIPSTAYTAWWLMGNLEGTGGPVPQKIIDNEHQMALKILERMRSLGMQPISQSFFGMVPSTFKDYYPKAKVIDQFKWGSFKRPEVLAPTDPLFADIAEVWYRNLHQLYGKFDYYGGDLFHEGGNSAGLSLKKCAKSVEKQMQSASSGAVYVLQGWQTNPKKQLLKGLSDDNSLIQKLQFRMSAQDGNFGRDFKKKNWTLNLINNFGGGQGLYGNLKTVSILPNLLTMEENKDCIGIGYLCEGTETNPIFYDLLAETFWSSEAIDLDKWVENYTIRRYGKKSKAAIEAWKILSHSIYNVSTKAEGQTDSIICARPSLTATKARTWSSGDSYWNKQKLKKAATLLLSAADELENNAGYQYDLTDLYRQILQDEALTSANNSEKMIQLIDQTEALTATNQWFLLGNWIEAAKNKTEGTSVEQQYAIAAKLLITRWEPKGQLWVGINDYSNRTWSGLISDYYKLRWNEFYNGRNYASTISDTEYNWVYKGPTDYPTNTTGYTISLCKEIQKNWIEN